MSCEFRHQNNGLHVQITGVWTPEDMVQRANALEAYPASLACCITDCRGVQDHLITPLHLEFIKNLEFALSLSHPTTKRVFIAEAPDTRALLEALLHGLDDGHAPHICATEQDARSHLGVSTI